MEDGGGFLRFVKNGQEQEIRLTVVVVASGILQRFSFVHADDQHGFQTGLGGVPLAVLFNPAFPSPPGRLVDFLLAQHSLLPLVGFPNLDGEENPADAGQDQHQDQRFPDMPFVHMDMRHSHPSILVQPLFFLHFQQDNCAAGDYNRSA